MDADYLGGLYQGAAINSLAQYQQSPLLQNHLSMQSYLQHFASPRPVVRICDPMEGQPLDAVEEGERIIAQIAFWRAVPVIGGIVAGRLADQLDSVTDAIKADLRRQGRLRVLPVDGATQLIEGETVTIDGRGEFEVFEVGCGEVEVIDRGN